MILYAWPVTPAQHLHAGRSDTQRISGKNRHLFSAPHLCCGHEWGQCYPHNKIHDWTGEALLKNKICTGHLTSVLKYVYYVHTEYLCYRSTQAPSPFLMLCHTLFLFNTFGRPSTDDTGELCAAKDRLYPVSDRTAEIQVRHDGTSPPALFRTKSSAGHYLKELCHHEEQSGLVPRKQARQSETTVLLGLSGHIKWLPVSVRELTRWCPWSLKFCIPLSYNL